MKTSSCGLPAAVFAAAFVLASAFLFGLSAPLAHATNVYGCWSDAQVKNVSGTVTVTSTTSDAYCGRWGGQLHNAVYVFRLPSRPDGQYVSNADLSSYFYQKYGSATTYNADLYGLPYRSGSDVQASDYYVGTSDMVNTLIQDSYLTSTSATGRRYLSVDGAANLADYLNAQYDAGATSNSYVFIRANPDCDPGNGTFESYKTYTMEFGGTNNYYYAPQLTINFADRPPGVSTVPLGGAGALCGLTPDPTGATMYCRTDVGGAFRWNAATGSWMCITDTLVSVTGTLAANASGGVAGIAIDPNNTNTLYVAAGQAIPGAGIYASTDAGANWTLISGTLIKLETNTAAKNTGERLVVDPNNSNRLWCATQTKGLWQGLKSGTSWNWTQIPSTSVPFGNGSQGVTFVACDKNSASTITYAGVYDTGTSGNTGGVYRSLDSGTTWSRVGGFAMPIPVQGRVADNGTLYVTGSSLGKLVRGGDLVSITGTLSGVNLWSVAIAASDPSANTVYVAERGTGNFNRIYRTTDGGVTWGVQTNPANTTRTEPDGTKSLSGGIFSAIGALAVTATNANELWCGELWGVNRTQDAQHIASGTAAYWYTLQKGQEETCMLCVKNAPSGAELMTGIADAGGWRYNDVTKRPYTSGTYQGGNMFGSPQLGNNCSLDFCEADNNVWARTCVDAGSVYGTMAVSTDGGVTWMGAGSPGAKMLANGTAAWEGIDISTYLSIEKAKGTQTMTLVINNDVETAIATGDRFYGGTTLTFDSLESGTANAPRLLINGTCNLLASEDSYVNGGATTTNYGTATTLQTNSYYGNNKMIYLKFDLSSAPPITSCTLQLHRQAGNGLYNLATYVYVCTNNTWTQGAITWSNKPASLGGASPVYSPNYGYRGGRVAVSATNSRYMIWMPEGTSNVCRYTTDRGVTWTASTGGATSMMSNRFTPSTALQQITADRVNGKFYMAKFYDTGCNGGNRIYSSVDNGATWSVTGTCPGSSNPYRCQIMGTLVANELWISDDGVNGTTGGGMYRSTDGGATWRAKLPGISGVRCMGIGKPKAGSSYSLYFYGFYNMIRGIYRSDDYGATWSACTQLPTIAPISSLAGDRQNYGYYFMGTDGRGTYVGY